MYNSYEQNNNNKLCDIKVILITRVHNETIRRCKTESETQQFCEQVERAVRDMVPQLLTFNWYEMFPSMRYYVVQDDVTLMWLE